MSSSAAMSPTQRDAIAVHQRLLAQDPTAANDVAEAYLEPLIVWLGEIHSAAPVDVRVEAAEDAILALIRKPESYSPGRQTLEVYLRMSARGDLRNLLRKERRHNKGRISWSSVELSSDAGKHLGRSDDPALPMRLTEEMQNRASTIPDSVRQGLSEMDLHALALILQKERKTSVYAALYGLLHLSAKEQRSVVKRHKDRLKHLLKRAGRKP